jgi:hypothetical protein
VVTKTVGPAMGIKDVVDLLFAARARIDFHWNFYVVVVVATIGWLVSLKRPLSRPMKLLVSVAYLTAATMNVLALCSAYTFAEALRTDLLRMAAATPLTDTRHILEQHSYLSQRTAALVTHVVIGASILFVVWFARFREPRAQATDFDEER